MFMAKQELFKPRLIGNFLDGLGAFPVHRGRLDRKAIRQAQQVLADGMALVMFPEGTRSRSAQLQSAFSGPALIAAHSGAPILPVGIIGTEKIRGVGWLLHRPKITINVGQPFNLPPVSSRLTKEELAELTDFIMGHIAALLPPKYRGDYEGKELR
jgi:1-acyl-sn-glycerol-3-phosphate acyltransferase